jgi:hypothetical protein
MAAVIDGDPAPYLAVGERFYLVPTVLTPYFLIPSVLRESCDIATPSRQTIVSCLVQNPERN